MIPALLFALRCFRLYRACQVVGGVGFHIERFADVPHTVMIVATGREAWRVSDFATTYFANRRA